MPQVTLSVPNEKLPILKDFLSALGIESKNMQHLFQKSSFAHAANSSADTDNNFFAKHFSWEYFRNELEFE